MRARIAKTLGWSIALGLAAVLAAPAAANAQAETQTIHFSGMTQTQPAINPCSGAPGTLTATFSGRATGSDGSSVSLHGVTHATVNAGGTVTVDFEIGRVSCG